MSSVSSDLMNTVLEMFSMMRNEFIIFVIAVTVHGLLFSSHRVGGTKKKPGVEHKIQDDSGESTPKVKPSDSIKIERHIPKAECDKYATFRQQEREVQAGHINALKALQRGVPWTEVDRTLVAAMNQHEADEALLTAIVDATIRVGRSDLLQSWVRKQKEVFQRVKRAHTFSSIIRAYGACHDVTGVWDTWSNMRKSHVTPTCVTLGCMVEALVANGDPDSAYDLVQEIRGEENEGKSVVNAVIYGTVLKGFAHQKKFNRVWAVYQEMLAIETDFTIVTFNTIIDACARCEELHRIPTLLKDMDRLMIQPNIITYGAILKGYCQEGNLDKAYELLRSMKDTTDFKPDEIMYNSLLDGCCLRGLWDRGTQVLQEMQEAGIKPSNFTLSVLVKLARRSNCSLGTIFSLCDEIAHKYRFKLNIHVFGNLVHASIARKDFGRAVATVERMVKERVQPDVRTYSLLIKGLVEAGEVEQACGALRAALNLPNANMKLSTPRSNTHFPRPTLSELVEIIVMACEASQEDVAVCLLRDVKNLGLSLDPKVKLRFATRITNTSKGRVGQHE